MLTVALSTYIGYSQEKAQTPPVVSSHSVPILKADEFDVEFTTEFTVNNKLVELMENKIYFQVFSKESQAAIEFFEAKLMQVIPAGTTEVLTVQHINNGRSEFTFTPLVSLDTSDGFANYYLRVFKTKGGEYKEFKLPEADKEAVLNA